MNQIVNKLSMFTLSISDMPRAKAFYADTLGLKVTKDFRQDDQNWWVTLTSTEGGVSINLARYGENIIKPGTSGLCSKMPGILVSNIFFIKRQFDTFPFNLHLAVRNTCCIKYAFAGNRYISASIFIAQVNHLFDA